MISQPKILLLDEPTTGVDPVSRREFWDVLAAIDAEGVTVVVATPYLDEAERCDRIALMYEGKIQQIGTLSQLRESLGLQRLEVQTQHIEAAERVLHEATNSKHTSIVDVQTFGDRLDVLVKDVAVGTAAVQTIFTQQRLQLDSIQTTDQFYKHRRLIFALCDLFPFLSKMHLLVLYNVPKKRRGWSRGGRGQGEN
ncbi:hypothetical protein [Nostoc sp.]|uniref:hypothetical protein n=1 Tax=Nostoc sp. TaxID=1180 RepID=UPI003FA54656